MASGTAGPETRTPVPPSAEVVEYGQFIEGQLRKTRSQVKWVEVSAGLMTLAAGILGYLFLVAIVDSWIVSAGFGRAGRWLCLFGLMAGGAAYFARAVLPLCLRRVNPVYAA